MKTMSFDEMLNNLSLLCGVSSVKANIFRDMRYLDNNIQMAIYRATLENRLSEYRSQKKAIELKIEAIEKVLNE